MRDGRRGRRNVCPGHPFSLSDRTHLRTRRMVKKTIGGAKNGGSREVAKTKAPKYYPADDEPTKAKRQSTGVAKLRKSKKGQVRRASR